MEGRLNIGVPKCVVDQDIYLSCERYGLLQRGFYLFFTAHIAANVGGF